MAGRHREVSRGPRSHRCRTPPEALGGRQLVSTRLPFRLLADTEWLREPPPASRRRSMEATDDARRREAVRLMATYALNSAPLLHIARGAYDRRSAPDTIVAVVFAASGWKPSSTRRSSARGSRRRRRSSPNGSCWWPTPLGCIPRARECATSFRCSVRC